MGLSQAPPSCSMVLGAECFTAVLLPIVTLNGDDFFLDLVLLLRLLHLLLQLLDGDVGVDPLEVLDLGLDSS